MDNLGQWYATEGKKEQAEDLLLKSLAIRQQLDSPGTLAKTHRQLGDFYLQQKDFRKALTHLNESEQIATEINNLQTLNNTYEQLAKAYAGLKNYKSAFQYQTLFQQTQDSLWNEDRNKQLTRMETQFETKQKEEKIIQLESEAKLIAAAHAKDRQIGYLLIGGAVLLAALVFLFFNRSRLLKIKNSEIEEKSQLLATSLTEKETLLKEIHHRVKNNLQIISGLLNLQSRQVSDEQTLATIREGQSRVQAMSLIHQNLYQSEQLSNVDIEKYLHELTSNISEMFQQKDKNISIAVNAPNIQFDIDTAIPLGLIVNELVSNAYKYAFEGKQMGNIRIAIKALNEGNYELKVSDDGVGLPMDFQPTPNRSLGLQLVNILSQQLRGSVNALSQNGAVFNVMFKELKIES